MLEEGEIRNVDDAAPVVIEIPDGWKCCRFKGFPADKIIDILRQLKQVIRDRFGDSSVRIVNDRGEDMIYFNDDELVRSTGHKIHLDAFKKALSDLKLEYPGIEITFYN